MALLASDNLRAGILWIDVVRAVRERCKRSAVKRGNIGRDFDDRSRMLFVWKVVASSLMRLYGKVGNSSFACRANVTSAIAYETPLTFFHGNFDSAQLELLQKAFNGACQELGITPTDAETRKRIAESLMALARIGEFDHDRLRLFAVKRFGAPVLPGGEADKIIGDHVRFLREGASLTTGVVALAARLGVADYIASEKGSRRFSTEELFLIAAKLDVGVADIMDALTAMNRSTPGTRDDDMSR